MQAVDHGSLVVTQLFPVLNLGHSSLCETSSAGRTLSRPNQIESLFFLAFLVGLHLATAIALVIFYRGPSAGFVLRTFSLAVPPEDRNRPTSALLWLLVAATIPHASSSPSSSSTRSE